LVDWRKVRPVTETIPAATIRWWGQMAEQYTGRKNVYRRAYEACIHVARLKVHMIPGYENCGGYPELGAGGVPRGWSYRTFCRSMPQDDYSRTIARTGRAAAATYRPGVYTTRVGLRCGSVYMLDDVWHDFYVKPTLKSESMRLLELCCMDLFSAKRVLYGTKAEREDDNGVRERIRERDMRFLLAAVLSLHGYRKDGTVLIGEHGTAIIRENVERILHDRTGGAITVQRGGITDSPALPGWYENIGPT
jgi:hypothetical protein